MESSPGMPITHRTPVDLAMQNILINVHEGRKVIHKCVYSGLLGYLARRMFSLLFTLNHHDQYLNTNTRIELLLNHPTLRISNNSKAIKDL